MAVIRAQRIHLIAVGVQREREVLVLDDPEVAVEAALEVGRLLLELVGERRILPDLVCEAGAAQLRVVGVALQLAGRPREAGQPAVPVGDRVPRILPALVLEACLLVAALVGDVAVAQQIGVLVDPVQRRPRLVLELAHELPVPGPAFVLVEQHDVQRRRVGAAVIGRMRPLLERRHLAVAHLVQDPTRVLVAEVVDLRALPQPEHAKRGGRELRRERQRLQAGEDAVPAEHGHEPRQTGGGEAFAGSDRRREAKRGKIDETAPVGDPERIPVTLQPGSVSDPALQVCFHALAAPFLSRRLLLGLPAGVGKGGGDLEIRRPPAVGLDVDLEGQALLVDPGRSGRGDRRCTAVRVSLVRKEQLAVLDPTAVLALLLERILDLEEVGEVGRRL